MQLSSENCYNNDDPFVEPAMIYTNIKGGLGCFGGYNTALLIVKP
ncbi:DUF4249 family protein [Dyadobacter sp. CY347]|nr:DUF4249 family protein [Dyadobacter sp. CY347]